MNTITLRPAEPERDFEQIAAWFATQPACTVARPPRLPNAAT
jgi:hypothetical protein